MARTASKNADKVKRGCPRIRMPWERESHGISFDPEQGRTHQSFKDECDIENIINLHTRTGMVTHLNPGQPQYGDNPDLSLFDAAVAQAEIRSAIEDGWEPPADVPEDSEPESDSEPETAPEGAETPPDTKNGDRGGEAEL